MKNTFFIMMLTAIAIMFFGCTDKAAVFNNLEGDVDSLDQEKMADGDSSNGKTDGDSDDQTKADGDTEFTPPDVSYDIVDTNQSTCFDDSNSITCPKSGAYFGQDAQYDGNAPRYKDNGDGTVTDLVTGLMWQQDPGAKQDYYEAIDAVKSFSLAGHTDWRVPTIKELYSLILFSGRDVDPMSSSDSIPFIDNNTFKFSYGNTSAGERIIDSQWVTSSIYTDKVMGGQECFFGVNFADGRIKCYPTATRPQGGYFAIYVRDGESYGDNDFTDNSDGTITDKATGLMWMQDDSKTTMNWEEALAYCESLDLASHQDWKLPNVKQLQSLVDYSRSPGHTNSPAIDPIFNLTGITNEAGQDDFGFYWSGTTHANQMGGHNASYVAFGRSMGYMNDQWMDVHGAGAQRSDPKSGDPSAYPNGNGPQGDSIHIYNFARCVRDDSSFNDNTSQPDGDTNPPADGDRPEGPPPADGDMMPPADGDAPPMGPTACKSDNDCKVAGACPDEATKGCTCENTPEGDFCIPNCTTNSDCPSLADKTLTCSPEGICIPEGGPQF